MSNSLFDNTSTGTAVAIPFDTNTTGVLAGGGGGNYRRLSIRGSAFREIVGGQEIHVHEGRSLEVVIVAAAPVNRVYYGGTYKEGETSAPTCWSTDSKVPDPQVKGEARQSDKCQTCPQNVKGSGQGDSRACRFQQRLAVAMANNLMEREVYQLAVPAASIFGEAENNKYPLQAYGRMLQSHKTPAEAIVTELRLDPSSSTPKLTFRAVRPLDADETAIVQDLRQDPATVQAVTLTVSQMDKVQDAPVDPKPAPKQEAKAPVEKEKPAPRKAKAATPPAEEEPTPEPTVSKPANKSQGSANPDISALVAEWDD